MSSRNGKKTMCKKERNLSKTLVSNNVPEMQSKENGSSDGRSNYRRAECLKSYVTFGVTNCGFFKVKVGCRNEEQWRWLFTLLKRRAVIVEMVPNLDLDSCFNALCHSLREVANNNNNQWQLDQFHWRLIEKSKSTSYHAKSKKLKNICFDTRSDGSSIHLQQLTWDECGSDRSLVARNQWMQHWGTDQISQKLLGQNVSLSKPWKQNYWFQWVLTKYIK